MSFMADLTLFLTLTCTQQQRCSTKKERRIQLQLDGTDDNGLNLLYGLLKHPILPYIRLDCEELCASAMLL